MAGSGGGELRALIFNGENFDFWLIKMKNIFRSHELWDLVENGYETLVKKEEELTETEKKLMRENMVKDARALGIIQGAISDQIFPRIVTQESAKVAWDILKQEFVGDKQVRSMKLQDVIENTKDLYIIDAHDVVAILKGYEQRLDRHGESSMEKAFASLNIAPKSNRFNGQPNSSKHQKNFKPKGKRWGNKVDWGNKATFPMKNDANNNGDKCKFCDRLHYGECWVKNKVKCHKCNKIGHITRYCNTNKVVQQVNFANQKISDEWYIDSGCSNHMTSMEDLLVDIDRNVKAKVQVGTGNLVKVAGKGTLIIETMKGRRYIREVMFVPSIIENLLSVGHMTEHGYFLLFGDYKVGVFDDRSLRNMVVSVKQKGNRCFPLIFSINKELALRTNVYGDAKMWHQRYGHLNFRSLKLLQSQ
ncbi:unnamed protein product [Malus baccata var. baccata]